MATNLRLAREQCENAFAQYIREQLEDGELSSLPVFVRKGEFDSATGDVKLETVEELPLPCVAVSAPSSSPHEMGYSVVQLHIMCLTSVDERNSDTDEANAVTESSKRFGTLMELFPDKEVDPQKHADTMAALNKPVSGPDERLVKNFSVFGFFQTEDQGQESERHWIDHAVFEVHCIPTDDTDGDGQD